MTGVRALVWLTDETWEGCVDAAARLLASDAEITLLDVTGAEGSEVAEGAMAGLLGRGARRRASAVRIDAASERAAAELLGAAERRLGRPARRVVRRGRAEVEVLAEADGAEVLVAARDGDRRRGPRSLGRALRFVVDHAPCPVLLVWPDGAPAAGPAGPPPPEAHRRGPPPSAGPSGGPPR